MRKQIKEFKIAYIILAHNQPNLLKRLISQLNVEGSTIFIVHWDRKKKIKELESLKCITSNIYLVEERVDGVWGGISLVKATLNAIKEMLRLEFSFDYAVLLSGQDYPVKDNQFIFDFFQYSEGNLYMEIFNQFNCTKEWQKIVFSDRLGCYNLILETDWYRLREDKQRESLEKRVISKQGDNSQWKLIFDDDIVRRLKHKFRGCSFPRQLPPATIEGKETKLIAWGGSQWWALPYDAVNYIDNFVKENPQYYDFHKFTFIPDEIFFQTIIMNHPEFSRRVINHRLKYLDWSRDIKPMVFNDEYLDYFTPICLNPFFLFARKFETETSNNILNQIDTLLNNEKY